MYDAIVIGVGSMGAAACDELSRRGCRVLGIDQFDPPHGRGSHHGDTRMFRMAYYEHPDYVPLLKRSRELWRSMEDVYREVGGLYIGPRESELVAGSVESARRHSLPHELLDSEVLQRRFPQFQVPAAWVGLFEPHAGYVLSERAISFLIARAERGGAVIERNQRVLSWRADRQEVVVATHDREHRARSLIVTSGAWTSKLLQDIGVRLTVTRQVLGWVKPGDPTLFAEAPRGSFPCWGIDGGDGSLLYGFPLDGHGGLKMARHFPGRISDPDSVDRVVGAADDAEFRLAIDRHMPAARGPTIRSEVCMYTNSPDCHFIIDRHPAHANVCFACGFSGHGFKFAPVIGEVLADLAKIGKTEHPAQFLQLGRFRR